MQPAATHTWHLRDVITLVLVTAFLAVVFIATDWFYTIVYALMASVGLGPFANEVVFGLWCMGGNIAFMVVRLPGSSVFGEVVGGMLESSFWGQFGIIAIINGFFQGIGSKLGFATYKYRRFDLKSLLVSAMYATVITFISALFIYKYIDLSVGMILALFLTRLASNLVFTVGLVWVIHKLLERSGILKMLHQGK